MSYTSSIQPQFHIILVAVFLAQPFSRKRDMPPEEEITQTSDADADADSSMVDVGEKQYLVVIRHGDRYDYAHPEVQYALF